MIGKGREQSGESKKSRERKRRKRKGETFIYRELYYCITFIIVIIIMPLPYYFHSIHINCLPFSPISPLFLPLPSFHSFIIFMSEV